LEQTAGSPVVEQPAAGGVGKNIGKAKAPSFYTTAFDEYLDMCFRGEVAQIFLRDSTSFQLKKHPGISTHKVNIAFLSISLLPWLYPPYN